MRGHEPMEHDSLQDRGKRGEEAGTLKAIQPHNARSRRPQLFQVSDQKLMGKQIRTKLYGSLTKFCEYFEFGAVRRCVNLVDIDKMIF